MKPIKNGLLNRGGVFYESKWIIYELFIPTYATAIVYEINSLTGGERFWIFHFHSFAKFPFNIEYHFLCQCIRTLKTA